MIIVFVYLYSFYQIKRFSTFIDKMLINCLRMTFYLPCCIFVFKKLQYTCFRFLVKGLSMYDLINLKIFRKGILKNKSNYTVNVKILNHKYLTQQNYISKIL